MRVHQERGEPDGDEGLEREGPAEPLQRQIEEGQVEQKEGEAEIDACGIVQEEGDTGGTAGQKSGTRQEIEAEGGDQAAGEDALRVLHRRVPGGAGVPKTENSACLCHGEPSDRDDSSIAAMHKNNQENT